MSRASIWAEVERLEQEGQRPVIKLPPSARVIVRRPPGRPRVRPLGAHQHYNWIMKTATGCAMRCRNPGCDKRLGAKQEALTCSPACEEQLRRYCEITLDVLNGRMRPRDYPPDLRSQKNSVIRRRR